MKQVKCGYIPKADTFQMRIHSKCGYLPNRIHYKCKFISIADTERFELFFAGIDQEDMEECMQNCNAAMQSSYTASRQVGRWTGR